MGVSENAGYLILGSFIITILLFRVLYWGPLFSETPISMLMLTLQAFAFLFGASASTFRSEHSKVLSVLVGRGLSIARMNGPTNAALKRQVVGVS